MPSGHPLPKGNESYHFYHRLTTCFRMHISDTQWRGTNTSPSLHHRRQRRLQHHLRQGTRAPQLQPAAWTIELTREIRQIGMKTSTGCCTEVILLPTLVSISTSLGITSPSPSGSTKLVAFPKFPTLPVRPAYETI